MRPLRAASVLPDISERPGLVGAPACGDVMKLQIKVKEGKIEDAVFKATPNPEGTPVLLPPLHLPPTHSAAPSAPWHTPPSISFLSRLPTLCGVS